MNEELVVDPAAVSNDEPATEIRKNVFVPYRLRRVGQHVMSGKFFYLHFNGTIDIPLSFFVIGISISNADCSAGLSKICQRIIRNQSAQLINPNSVHQARVRKVVFIRQALPAWSSARVGPFIFICSMTLMVLGSSVVLTTRSRLCYCPTCGFTSGWITGRTVRLGKEAFRRRSDCGHDRESRKGGRRNKRNGREAARGKKEIVASSRNTCA